jgi:hypothetical protein
MGDDQSNWSAPRGRTRSGNTTTWRQQCSNNSPPPDITIHQRQNNTRQSQLFGDHNSEETEVFPTPSFPSFDSPTQIIVITVFIFRKVFDSRKLQEQQHSCQVHVSYCSVKC